MHETDPVGSEDEGDGHDASEHTHIVHHTDWDPKSAAADGATEILGTFGSISVWKSVENPPYGGVTPRGRSGLNGASPTTERPP